MRDVRDDESQHRYDEPKNAQPDPPRPLGLDPSSRPPDEPRREEHENRERRRRREPDAAQYGDDGKNVSDGDHDP